MGLKEDAVFARYLTMGAHAAEAVARDLERHGHSIIELERYAKANKVWGIKVKRLRLPDLLCIRCGRRFESKGKSKLEIKLSHSKTTGREWYAGGMRLDDVFAFVRVALVDGDGSVEIGADVGRPVYVTRQALHDAEASMIAGGRKAASAGSESDVSWPAWAPSYAGVVVKSEDPSPSPSLFAADAGAASRRVIRVKKETGRLAAYRLTWPELYLYRVPGESFAPGDLVAGCVSPANVACSGVVWDWERDLHTGVQEQNQGRKDDRYAAIKASRFLDTSAAEGEMRALAENQSTDWRLRLEAAASLTTVNAERWIRVIAARAGDVAARLEEQMEAVFVLSELEHQDATAALASVARPVKGRHPEVRAAAVWGLGLGARRSLDEVAQFLDDAVDTVALHAAAVLPDPLPDAIRQQLVSWLNDGHERRAPMAAHVLARRQCIGPLLEVASRRTSFGGLLALRALGDLPRSTVEEAASTLEDALRELLMPIWVQRDDWLRKPENEGGIGALEQQAIRF